MRGLITPQMREAVAQGGAQWQSVGIRASDSDKVSPGILVGTQVQLPRAAPTSSTSSTRWKPTRARSTSFYACSP